MAPTKKSRSVNKRFSDINEESSDKDGGNANKNKQRKRKLSDMLGSQWSKEELVCFYEAFRKYGKDWKKVAGVVRNRSLEMVEALYNMNRAYLSLPEGTASVVGLIAMMTDHYNVLEESDSEQESNDASLISRTPQKRGRGNFRPNISKLDGHFPDLLHSQSIAPSNGCLSLLKKRRSGGSRPRAVGKRTPRVPISFSYGRNDKGRYISPNKQGPKMDLDANDDEVAHEVALALAEASQRGGSPQVSQTANRRVMRSSPIHGQRMHTESEIVNAKLIGTAMNDDCLEGSLGSREAENGDFARETNYMMDAEGVGTVEFQWKGKKFHRKEPKVEGIDSNYIDDVREACSGTEEGLNLITIKGKLETGVTNAKSAWSSPQGPRKRSRQLFIRDEISALDALQTLADLSLMMPSSTIESESSAQFKEEKKSLDVVDKSCVPEAMSANHKEDKPLISAAKMKGHQLKAGVAVNAQKCAKLGRDSPLNASALSEAKHPTFPVKMRKKKRKSLASKFLIPKNEAHGEPQRTEASIEEGKNSMCKSKRSNQIAPLPKQGKLLRPQECSSSGTDPRRAGSDSAASSVQVSTVYPVDLPTKSRSRRKIDLQKASIRKDLKSPEAIGSDQPTKNSSSLHDRIPDHKEKLSHCFSSQILRRWCTFEWFYSAIDYPWFAKREFVEYLNHVGLGHIPRLTRVEWGVIRSSLGKPRRLSEQFLWEEKAKLEQYRESVRKHYTELRSGIREGLPIDLARPLSVGQRVIACHPKTREIHDGSILTFDRNRCRVQFDRPELGVEFVMDIDCMPFNPLENMPEALRKRSVAHDKFHDNCNELNLNRPEDWKFGPYMTFSPSENPESVDGISHISSSTYTMNALLKQAKIQAREADMRALSELTRALDKKEALVLELKHMNDEVMENCKDGEGSLKESEPFKKQYATVLVLLKEANDQVSSALLYLRQRNTYQDNSLSPCLKSMATLGSTGCPLSSFDHSTFLSQESGTHVIEIVGSSRLKAKTMVDAAVQAVSCLKEGEDAFARIGEALDSANNLHLGVDSGISAIRSFTLSDTVSGSLPCQDQSTSLMPEPTAIIHASGPKVNSDSNLNEAQIPSELISSCVATLLMIQMCTERQYPPAEVAQMLDSAVSSLKPCCSQNLQVYGEIQRCMGIVKNQILALIPT